MSTTRRDFMAVAGLALVPALGIAGPAGASDPVEGFRMLSARLTGFSLEDIDPSMARDMLEGFAAAGDGIGLGRLMSGTASAKEDDLVRRIIVAWYSGIHPTAEGMAVRTFREALVWPALAYTKPPGDCSPEPADWNRAPSIEGKRP